MLIAVINGADYEYQGHIPFALKAGLTQEQLDDLPGVARVRPATTRSSAECWNTPSA